MTEQEQLKEENANLQQILDRYQDATEWRELQEKLKFYAEENARLLYEWNKMKSDPKNYSHDPS